MRDRFASALVAVLFLFFVGCGNTTGCAARNGSGPELTPEVYLSTVVAALDAGYLLAQQQRAEAVRNEEVGACVVSSFAVGLLPVGRDLLLQAQLDTITDLPAWSVDASDCGIARPETLPELTRLQGYVDLAFGALRRQLLVWGPTLQVEACRAYTVATTVLGLSETLAQQTLAAIERWELQVTVPSLPLASDC